MRASQPFLECSGHPVRRRRALRPTLEPLDGRWLPSPVHPIAPNFPRSARLEAREIANPRTVEAIRPRTAPRPVPPASTDPGPGPPGDAGGPKPDDAEQPTASGLIDNPARRAEAHDVAVALLSEDPQLPRARAHHAPRPLLPDEQPEEARGTAPDPPSPGGRPRAAGAVIPPPHEDAVIAAADAAAPGLATVARPTVAIITKSRPRVGLAPGDNPVIAAGPAESTPTWAIVLAGLAPALATAARTNGEAIPIHRPSRGEGRSIHRNLGIRP
jgi:hypothetical protein